MECNRDEALRAKEIAEKKFTAKDIMGAKKFALKAQHLYPELEGISQMLATFDVYLSAENKTNGETDWYAVLSVNASADDKIVKKQYRKLALNLHPDKNKCIGADGAFKLLSEAWSVLSDKDRRTTYDKRINIRRDVHRGSQPHGDAPAFTCNGLYNFANNSTLRTQKATSQAPPPPKPSAAPPASFCQPKPKTFWTACCRCKMQYEYLRVYLNHNLLCPNCHEPFLALETAHPKKGFLDPSRSSSCQQSSCHNSSNKTNVGAGKNSSAGVPSAGTKEYSRGTGIDLKNVPWGAFSRSAGVASATASSSAAAYAANMVHHTYDKVRREREAHKKHQSSKRTFGASFVGSSGINSSNNETDIPKVDKATKRRRGFDDIGGNEVEHGYGVDKYVSDPERVSNFSRATTSNVLTRELSMHDTRDLLLEKSKKGLGKKISEVNLENEILARKEGTSANVKAHDTGMSNLPINQQKQDFSEKGSSDHSNDNRHQEVAEIGSITYPDPDFHDFDMERLERCFEANQVWAAYDDDDGMPRFYAVIQKVISLKPFKLRISWLNSKTNSELSPLNWVASGFTKTCGEFRVGRYEICKSLNMLSHRIRWEKGVKGVVKVFPKKADVWALYRNWAPNWNETTPNEVIHKYDMVEVLEDYNGDGVLVTPLVKVAGFKTVFHRHTDIKAIKRIPREEMFRFSHQVPSKLLTGEEAPTVPKGCLELDPAATPLELLQVITETKEEDQVGFIAEPKLVS